MTVAEEGRKGGREEKVLIGCCGGRKEMGLLGRFWRSNMFNEIIFYHCLNEKLYEKRNASLRRGAVRDGGRLKVKVKGHVIRSIIIITFCT